jgi:predicted transposase YdaD
MSKPADIGGKRLVSLSPNNWAQWLTQLPQVRVAEMLDSDLQWVSRENDILLKVTSPETGDFLLLNELQLRYTSKLPRRMRAYSGLVEEKYELPVYPVLVNILPHVANPEIPTCYQSNFQGIQAYQDYKVINLWEVEVEIVFEQNLRSLLPFVPILKGGGEETAVREALRELREDEDLNELEPLLSFFASFVLELPVVQQIMRWDMAVLRESPWYQQILQEGIQEGRQEGRQEGIQEGRQEGELQLVLRLLNRRFGALDESLQQQIRGLSIEQLETLAEQLLDFATLQDLETWLNQN